MEILEKIYYEAKPYLCIGLAYFTLRIADVHSTLGKIAALALLILGFIILYTRLRQRGVIKW